MSKKKKVDKATWESVSFDTTAMAQSWTAKIDMQEKLGLRRAKGELSPLMQEIQETLLPDAEVVPDPNHWSAKPMFVSGSGTGANTVSGGNPWNVTVDIAKLDPIPTMQEVIRKLELRVMQMEYELKKLMKDE